MGWKLLVRVLEWEFGSTPVSYKATKSGFKLVQVVWRVYLKIKAQIIDSLALMTNQVLTYGNYCNFERLKKGIRILVLVIIVIVLKLTTDISPRQAMDAATWGGDAQSHVVDSSPL